MPSELDTHDLLFNPARRKSTKPRSDAGSVDSAPVKTTAETGEKLVETPRFAVARHIGGDEPEPLLSTRSAILIAVAVAAIAGAIFLFRKPKENPEVPPAAAATEVAPRPIETAPPAPTPKVSAAPPAASEASVASASAQPAASESSAAGKGASAPTPPAAKPITSKPVGPVASPPTAAPARAVAPKPAAAPAPASDNPYGDTPAPRKPAAAAPKSNDNPY
jgi:hypothetical protein